MDKGGSTGSAETAFTRGRGSLGPAQLGPGHAPPGESRLRCRESQGRRNRAWSARFDNFSFVDPAGELILWEHLGMLHREDYRLGWEWKRQRCIDNGFVEDETLFTTRDDEKGGLDTGPVSDVARKNQELVD